MAHRGREGNGGGRHPNDTDAYGYALSVYDEDDNYNYTNYVPPRQAAPIDNRRGPPRQHHPQQGQQGQQGRVPTNFAYPLRSPPSHKQQHPQQHLQQRPSRQLVGPNGGNYRNDYSDNQYRPPIQAQGGQRFPQDPRGHPSSRSGAPPRRPPRPAQVQEFPEDDYSQVHQAIPHPMPVHRPQPRQVIQPRVNVHPPTSLGQHPAERGDYSSVGPNASAYNPPPTVVRPVPTGLAPPRQNNQRRQNGPSRVSIPSYYLNQQCSTISPITEESSRQVSAGTSRASFASSNAIPADWESGDPPEYFALTPEPGSASSSSDNIGRLPIEGEREDENIEHGLVRQASMGRRSKPKLTQIGGQKPRAGDSSSSDDAASLKEVGGSNPIPVPAINTSNTSIPSARSVGLAPRSARSSVSGLSSPLAQPPLAASYFDEKPSPTLSEAHQLPMTPQPDRLTPRNERNERPPSRNERPSSRFGRRLSAFFGGKAAESKGDRTSKLGLDKELGEGKPAKKVPPPISIDTVRQAEARGSLTSLPDLILRATKLAAALEAGQRPASGNWGRDSFYGNSGAGRSIGRETDSLTDILSAFPPPVLGRNNSRFSRLSGLSNPTEDDSAPKKKRRICGVPVWGFILLIILAIIIIAAAVVVPLQMTALSKKADAASCTTGSAKCLNGGTSTFQNNICGCSCPSGFTGATCSEKILDVDCKQYKNVVLGSAVTTLIDSSANYQIPLDSAIISAQFDKEGTNCTFQNSLVAFNGANKIKRDTLVIDTSPQPSMTNIRDFAGIGVLYLLQKENVTFATNVGQTSLLPAVQQNQENAQVPVGSYVFRFEDKTIVLPDRTVVGGSS